MRYHAPALGLLIAMTLLSDAATGQVPVIRRDTTVRDSVRQDTLPGDSLVRRPIHHPGMYLILPVGAAIAAAGTAVGLVAPPAFLLLARRTDPNGAPPIFREDHVDVYLTAGPAFTTYVKDDAPWAHSESVEVLWDGRYGELRLEHFYMPGYVQYATGRAGRLIHPSPVLSGGMTVGYRDARGVRGQSGFELGLPLIVGGPEGWFRVETTYVFSRRAANWNLRTQGIYPIPGRSVFAGLTFEVKSLPLTLGDQGQFASALSLVAGFRY